MAREHLLNNYGIAVLATLILSLIVSAIQSPFRGIMVKSVLRGYSYDELLNMNLDNFTPYFNPVIISTCAIAYILILLATMVLQAGMTKIYLNISRDQPARLSMLFGQFKHRPYRFMVYGILFSLITIAIQLVGPILLAFHIFSGSGGVILLSISIALIILSSFVTIWITLRFMLVPFLLVDTDMGAVDAMRESWHLMSGHCGRAFYIMISFIGLSFVGILSFGLAFFWITPYITVTSCIFYQDITGEIDRNIAQAKQMDEEMGPMMEA